MHEVTVTLKIFDPSAPAPQPPAPALTPDVLSFGPQVFVPHDQPSRVAGTAATPPAVNWDRFEGPAPGPVAAQAAAPLRRPIRDRLRAGLVDAIQRAAPVPVGAAEVEEALAEATAGRPLIDWLANGGLQKLIEVVLAILKLAA